MEFLYFLEGIRTPAVDRIMLLVTQLGVGDGVSCCRIDPLLVH